MEDKTALSSFVSCFRFIPLTGSSNSELLLYAGAPIIDAATDAPTLQFAIADFSTSRLWNSSLKWAEFEQKQEELKGGMEDGWATQFFSHLADALKSKQWTQQGIEQA